MKTFLNAVACLAALVLAPFAHSAAPPPDNDTFANRIALVASGSISIQARNASATSEASEPTIDGEVVWRSVWWSWTAPFSGPTTITTAGSSFDTLLGVFTGTSIATLASIAENDDAGGLYTSSVTFQAVGGVPYALLVGGVNNAGGKVRLSVNVAAGPCSFALSPSSRSVSNVAGTSTVGVTTTTGCAWSATSNDAWLTITAGSSGTGSGTVSYAIAANTALTPRTGTLTVAGLTHSVVQAAAPACAYSIVATNASFTASPATNSFVMTAGTGCAWTATPNAPWLTIQSGASGTGNGTTTYVVATNSLSNQRVGTITVAGLTHTVTQAGTVPCTWSISPTSALFTSSGGTSNIVISTQTACAWTASSPASWVTFSTTNGTGNATVTYTVAANVSTVARSTTLTVAGNSFAVTQSGAACTYSLSPTSVSVSSTGTSSGTITVTAGTGCAWSAVANASWLTVTSGSSGNGPGTVGYSVAANPDTSSRTNSLTIGGQTFTVTQAAAPCSFSIAPTAAHYSDATGTGSIAVTAGTGCAWTAVSNDAFLTVNSGTPGSGSGTVGYTVAANVTTSSRTGTITVAGSTFTVTQDGTTPCTYGISPSSASYTSTGGSSSVAVTANAGCTWSASSAASWITISTASGSGNGTVGYTVAANTSSQARTGNLTIAGNPFTVSQSGAPCVFAISPVSSSFSYTGGSGSVAVTATSGCTWTSSSDSSWLTATNGASGTGNGTLIYSVASTTSPATRIGRLTIAGKLLTVTQTGAPCVTVIDPPGVSVAATLTVGQITVTESDTLCTWTAVPGAAWISVSPSSGTGNGTVNYTVASTAQTSSRSSAITIGGQTFSITQAGDSSAPTITLTAPAAGSTVSNTITISATATDNVGVSHVDFYRDSAVLLGSLVTGPYNLPFNTTNVSNGAHSFYAIGFDTAGNQGLSTTNSVTVSNSSPSTNFFAQAYGGLGADAGTAIALDSSGNVIIAGYFTGTVDFGGGVLTGAGAQDIFVAKFNSSGVHQWSKRYGSAQNDQAVGVAVDSAGNVIITGTFVGTVDFGDGPVTSTWTGVGADTTTDVFILKLNSSGAFVWKRKFDNTVANRAYGIAVDSSGNVLFCGSFTGHTSLANDGFTTYYATFGSFDIVVGKFNGTTGALIWSKQLGGTAAEEALGVAADPSTGDMLVTGYFDSTMNFGGGSISPTGGTGDDIFLARYGSAAGAYVWSKTFGSTANDRGQSVAVDSSGNVVFTGQFSGTINFGNGNLTSGGGVFDVFAAKYNGAGTSTTWTKRAGSPVQNDYGAFVAADGSGNTFLTGNFAGTADFGTISTASAGLSDVYASKLSAAGLFQTANAYGGTQSDLGLGVAVNSNGVYVTGSFQTSAFFNGITLTAHGSGDRDIFLMRIAP